MCIICEKGRSLATLNQILDRLERDGKQESDLYQYVMEEVYKLKAEMDGIEEGLKQLMKEYKGIENTLFYPVIDDEKQSLKN